MKVISRPKDDLYEKKFGVELTGEEIAILYVLLGPSDNKGINRELSGKELSTIPRTSSTPYNLYVGLGELIGR